MEKRRGAWLILGTRGRLLSRVFQPDNSLMRDVVLNLLAIVGFIFFALILLHLVYDVHSSYAFQVYLGIFLILEGTVIAVKMYTYMRRRNSNYSDIESVVQVERQTTEARLDSKWDTASSSRNEPERRRRNSF